MKIGALSKQQIEKVQFIINIRPRKALDYLSAYEFLAGKLAALEHQYNSLGLTRLTAQKELLTSLLILITGTPATNPQPYRKDHDNNQSLDSFDEYLTQCQLRLETLHQQQAFDPVYFSEHSRPLS
jgi:hypothetical protein